MSESEVLRTFTATLGLQVNLAGTGNTEEIEKKRVFLLAGFALRTLAPLVLSRLYLLDEARRLRRCAPLKNAFDANLAAEIIDEARTAAHTCYLEATSKRAAHDRLPRDAANPTEMLCAVKALNYASHTCLSAVLVARGDMAVDFRAPCAASLFNAITEAINAGVPEDELIDLALDAVADAMVIQ